MPSPKPHQSPFGKWFLLDIALALALAPASFSAHGQNALAPTTSPVQALRFTIAQFRFQGNTLVDDASLQTVLQPLLGSGKTLADLNAARQAILAAYRDQGYELLSVDYDAVQSRGGNHLFRVREVKIAKISVTGVAADAAANVLRQLPGLQQGLTPNLNQLARELFLFNDNPSRSVALAYRPADPGTTDVEIRVSDKNPLHIDLALNNTGSDSTGNTRLGISLRHDNLFDKNHQFSVGFTTSPEKPGQVLQISAAYRIPLPSLGDTVVLSASDSSTDVGLVSNIFNVAGKGTTLGAHYQRNLWRDGVSRHVLDVGYDERRLRDVVDFFGINLGTSVTTRPLSVGYRYQRLAPGDSLALGLALQNNLPGGDLNDDATYAASRVGASANWQTLQLQANWQHEFSNGWMPVLRLSGQASNGPLVASEQFGLGGLQAVRGFAEREGTGDNGMRLHLELFGPRLADKHRLLAFLDAGQSTRLNPQPGELASQTLTSFGIGWRAQFDNGLGISLDAAKVVAGTVANPQGSTRLHVAASWFF